MMKPMTLIDRRAMIAATGAALLLPRPLFAAPDDAAFSWDRLVAQAQRLTRSPFRETPAHPGAARVDYDALHQARFRDDRTVWDQPRDDVGIRFFPLSKHANQPVTIALVENGRARPLRYDPAMFDLPAGNAVGALGPDAGFSGFRVMNAARDADWLSFLGASYFRAAGAQRQYGLSARAVAINTSLLGREEFPRFTHFWLERTGSSTLRVYALLDGASITGAFRFDCRLTAQGVVQDVIAALFPRRTIDELGLMPMTSMFWYDQAQRTHGADWRPEIHDSDMLSIASANGTVQARPIVNPRNPQTSIFEEVSPKGFGLLQRDRDFSHYQDDGVFYERRPSLWATPQAPWGKGAVRLFTFPTDSEYTDNVASYWTPAVTPRAGRRIDLRYRLDWSSARYPDGTQLARVEDIWHGPTEDGGERLVIDFAGAAGDVPDMRIDVAGGALTKKAGYFVQDKPGLFRAVVDVKRNGQPTEIRLQLRRGGGALSEYVHYPLGI